MEPQTQQTFEWKDVRQLVVLIRYKPAAAGGYDMGGATSMLSSITDKVDAVTSAIEDVMSNIPGLDMFVKEEKNNPFPADEAYTFYDDYSVWDQQLSSIKDNLKELHEESKAELFEFSDQSIESAKAEGEKLFGKVEGWIADWKKYTVWIHLIGIGQSSGVIGVCSQKMAGSEKFKQEKWVLKSAIHYASGIIGKEYQLNPAAFKKEGKQIAFSSAYDLTAQALHYFDQSDALIQLIKDSNKNTLSLATGKVKLRIIKAMSIILSGLNISANDTSQLDKFSQIKDELVGLVKDMIDFVKTLIDEGTSYIKLPDLPDFGQLSNGFDGIADQVKKEFDDFLNKEDPAKPEEDGLLVKLKKGAKNTNLSVGPSDLAMVLNCLCPLFDQITKSLSVLKVGAKDAEQIALQVIDKAGIKKVFNADKMSPATIITDLPYVQAMQEAAKQGNPDTASALVQKVQGLLKKASAKTQDIQQMSSAEKMMVAEAITSMTIPMLPSKIGFYKKLLEVIPFNLAELTQDYTMGKLGGMASEQTSKIGISFPDKLTASMAAADAEVKRIKMYFDKNAFSLAENRNSMYLIYNAHNLTLKQVHGELKKCIDTQTGYMSWMYHKGYDYTGTYEYVQGTQPVKENAIPVNEIEPTTA
jgi:hypothetical protein